MEDAHTILRVVKGMVTSDAGLSDDFENSIKLLVTLGADANAGENVRILPLWPRQPRTLAEAVKS